MRRSAPDCEPDTDGDEMTIHMYMILINILLFSY
jgi:hypothetical protein